MKNPFIYTLIIFLLVSCKKPKEQISPLAPQNNHVINKWVDFILKNIKSANRNSPTYCSRSIGYICLTMHESVCHGSKSTHTFASKLNGFDQKMPLPDPESSYNWSLSYNAATALIFKNMYGYLSTTLQNKIDSLENAIYEEYARFENPAICQRSSSFGKEVATKIYNWSITDGGHEGYKYGFPTNYEIPVGLGLWVAPTGNAQSPGKFPLHPFWGNNRKFILINENIPLPNKLNFDSLNNSTYYNIFWEVYIKNQNLTLEEKEIALWWGDDPSLSYSPPGHSMNISKIITNSENLDLFKGSELLALTGITLADAFSCCWKIKYHYNSERPSSYIHKYINSTWVSFWPEPLFPAFPSGHSTQIGGITRLFKLWLKKDITINDNTNSEFAKDTIRNVGYHTRTFHTFEEMAFECANSRLYGGIHTQEDNNFGLELGYKIGENVYKTLIEN